MAIPINKSIPTDVSIDKPKEKKIDMASEMKETHTVIRTISGAPSSGAVTVADIDAYLNTWLSQGWRILNTHYLGNPPEGWIIAWILVR